MPGKLPTTPSGLSDKRACLKVLHVAAEIYPLVKTGGLADVVAALPPALAEAGADVRLLLPGLPAILDAVQAARTVIDIGACFGALRVRLLLGRMPGSQLPVYVVDAPHLYRRGGSPYLIKRRKRRHAYPLLAQRRAFDSASLEQSGRGAFHPLN